MSLQKRRSNPIHFEGIDLRWSVSVRSLSSPGEGLLVVQANHGQRLVVRLALNDLWIHGPGPRHSVTPSLVRHVMDDACGLGWTPDSPGPEFHATLNDDDCLTRTQLLRSYKTRSRMAGNNPMQPSGEVRRVEVDDQSSPPADR